MREELALQAKTIAELTEALEECEQELKKKLNDNWSQFQKNSEMALDAQRFQQIIKGLHVHTTVEERFEQITAKHDFECEGTLLQKIKGRGLLLVNGPERSLRLVSTKDLSLVHELERKPVVLSDETRVAGDTWGHFKTQAMSDDFDINTLSEED